MKKTIMVSTHQAYDDMPKVFTADMLIARTRNIMGTGVSTKDGDILRSLRYLRQWNNLNYKANRKSQYTKA